MMDDNNAEAIWNFGKEVIIRERDAAIRGFFSDCDLHLAPINKQENSYVSNYGQQLVALASKLNISEEALNTVKILFVEALDCFINSLFWNFEQSNGKYKIVTQDKNGQDFDIVTESDGLCTGQWEFIERYSKYNTAEDMLRTGEIEKKPEE